jgi:hypothetical protein
LQQALCTLFLLFAKSIIVDDIIILSDGIFKIDAIKSVEMNNKRIKIYLKKNSVYAPFGNKEFIANDKNINEIYDYINNKIVK